MNTAPVSLAPAAPTLPATAVATARRNTGEPPVPLTAPAAAHPIDALVTRKLAAHGIAPAARCTDAEFLRRACLDLMGALPPPDFARRFLADSAPSAQKRAALVEWIFGRPEFADYWAMRWADVLRVKSEFPSNLWPDAVQAYHAWLRERFAANTPFTETARALLTTPGSNFRDPPCNFYRALPRRTPAALAQSVALVFLGMRLDPVSTECNALAAFFTNVRYKNTDEWKEEVVYFAPYWPAHRHPVTNAIIKPAFPDGRKPPEAARPDTAPAAATSPKPKTAADAASTGNAARAKGRSTGATRKAPGPFAEIAANTKRQREETERNEADAARDTPAQPPASRNAPPRRDPQKLLADWLTAPDNPWFAANFANRTWAALFGRGLTHPVDDVRASNPPADAALMELLARRARDHQCDLRDLLRFIVQSETYQRTARLPAAARRALPPELAPLAARVPRRLEAEVLADAIGALTGSYEAFFSRIPEPLAYWPENFRAVQNPDASVTTSFLDSFGRPARDSSYAHERDLTPSLSQALWLLNSRALDAKLEKKGGRLEQLIRAHAAPDRHAALADEFYLILLSRHPGDAERAVFLRHLATAPAGAPPLEQSRDLLWAILNTKEFLYSH